jgi:hypothetical protein
MLPSIAHLLTMIDTALCYTRRVKINSSPLLWYAPHGATKTMEEDMLGKHFVLALLGTTLITAQALAQTNPPAGSTTAAPAVSTTAPASGAMSTGTWMTQEQPGHPRAPATATAPATPAAPGTVNPNAPATTGTVATDRTAANRSAPDHAVLTMNMTKDQLKAAPEFKYAR